MTLINFAKAQTDKNKQKCNIIQYCIFSCEKGLQLFKYTFLKEMTPHLNEECYC